MRRYWVPKEALQGELVDLSGDVFHHICVVCRQTVGNRFEVIVDSTAFFVEIIEQKKKSAVAKVIEQRKIPELPKPHIHLALSLPKFTTLEKVLEKSVELGVHTLHLFHSDFSYMRPKSGELAKKQMRWQKIIKGATQQAGRGDLMSLTDIEPLGVLLERFAQSPDSWGVLAFEGEADRDLKEQMAKAQKDQSDVWIFVGAEGGFSPGDLELFKNYDLLPISLGDQVLRVETACVTLVSVLKYGLGHFD